MVRHRGVLLLDTNVIVEAHRTGSWRALVGGYRVETVEDCVNETQTGFQRRRPEQQIDGDELRDSLGAVHPIGDLERAELKIRTSYIELHIGEASPWAGTMNGSCANRTKPVFVAASGSGSGSGWCHWKDFSMMSATGLELLCARNRRGTGTRGFSANWSLWKETGSRDDAQGESGP